jgi:hypothetical protein
MQCVDDEPAVEQETGESWTNPHTAEYKRRQQMLMAMRPFGVIAMLRDLNVTSYAFSKNAEELQAHIYRYPEIGQSQPFNPDVGDPFGIELARLLANLLASVGSLISGQRVVLRDIWPRVGKELSDFEQGEYATKRLAVLGPALALALSVGLAFDDEFVGRRLQSVHRGLGLERVGHHGQDLGWFGVTG